MKWLKYVLSMVVLCAASASGNISLFEARIDFEIGSSARISGADLDDDGDHDLIVTLSGSNGVKIMLNNGDGSYASPILYSSGYSTSNIIPGDYDGDNDLDLVLVSMQDTSRVLLNDGSGNFSLAVGAGLPRGMSDGFAADLDGDGDNDLALRSGWPFIYIYLNNGTGEFAYLDMYIPCETSMDVFGGDLDGDGDIDMAVADPGIDVVHILLNNGDATFTPSTSVSVVDIMAYVEGGDLDGDGDCDLIIDHGNVAVLTNNGDATFAGPADVELPLQYLTACADYDGDGDIDLMGGGGGYVTFLSNNGDATFSQMAAYAPEWNEGSLYGADVDGDGDVDLAGCDQYRGEIFLILNNGDGVFPEAYSYGETFSAKKICGSDFDGDGDLDLAGSFPGHGGEWWYNPGNVVISLNNGDGTFESDPSLAYGFLNPGDMCKADFDGDGDEDIAVVHNYYNDRSVTLLVNDGSGSFTPTIAYNYEMGNYPSLSGADLDDDGDCDLALAIQFDGLDSVFVLMNDGAGTFGTPSPYEIGESPTSVLCTDLNGDNDADLIVTCSGEYPDSGCVSILLNTGDGTFESSVSLRTGLHPLKALAADLNGDMIIDLAVLDHGDWNVPFGDSADLAVLFGNGDGSFSSTPDYYLKSYGAGSMYFEDLFAADFDADGDVDLAATKCFGYESTKSPEFETDYDLEGLLVLLNEGDGTYPTVIAYGVNQYPYYPYGGGVFGGDVDGDGDIDLAVGTLIFTNTTNGGSCTGDSDCDGVPDVVDNCPHTDNPGQADADADGAGDLCDICPGFDDFADADGDAVPDACDNCPALYNPDQDNTDTDADGIPDACDICPGFDDAVDSDGDGIPDGCDAICGDANADRDVNVGDAVHLITYIFKGGAAPDPLCSGEASGDDVVNIGDAVYLINYIFKGGPPPVVSCCAQPPVRIQGQ